jgi:circadian clock protein KaiC
MPLEPTGVPRLDLILGGGLPRGALAIILGPPGSGKTTLASQIAFAAAQRGQRVLFLTALSEPTTKLLTHLQTYHFFDPKLIGNTVQVFSLQQFFSQSGSFTGQEIFATVRQTHANIVILDGFQGIRGSETNFAATRQLLYDLGTRLSLLGTTTILTTEADPRDPTLYPEMTTGDVLIGLYYTLLSLRATRSLEVLKVRGRAPLTGRHSMQLTEAGIEVFPRLETRIKRTNSNGWTEAKKTEPQPRANFGLEELDALLGGGLTRHTSTLLAGSLGTGKTLLTLHFILTGIQNKEPALLLGFRETVEQLLQKADAFDLGNQLRAALAPDGSLTLQHWDPVELDPDQIATELFNMLEQTGARRLVIDSIAELERAVEESSGSGRTSNFLSALLAMLRERGITLLAIKEFSKSNATRLDFSSDTLSILAENVLFLQQIAYQGRLHRVLSVLKMRFSAFDHTLREFVITSPEGIQVLSPEGSAHNALANLSEEPVDGGISTIGREPPPEV